MALALLCCSPSAAHAATCPTLEDAFYVDPGGRDTNPGSRRLPFGTINRGVRELDAGDTLCLRRGVYQQSVKVTGKHGSPGRPMVIRAFPGEAVAVDGSLDTFPAPGSNDWEPVPGSRTDEYVSQQPVTPTASDPVNRGAFLSRTPYTRLITYARIEDLRATNQTFDELTTPPPPGEGVEVVPSADEPDAEPAYRPWVYMGPGLWFDENTRKVHIRLSRTQNGVPDLPDYGGPVDPRQVRLAIAAKGSSALTVGRSSNLRFKRMTFRHGGDYTARLDRVRRVSFDHVRFLAASSGVRTGHATDTLFRHCVFSGGMPSWYFRSDGKAIYRFRDGPAVETNILGAQTVRTLIHGAQSDTRTTIHHSEFVNGHDLHLDGRHASFHHNWVNNINDDAPLLDARRSRDTQVFRNAFTRVRSNVSLGGAGGGGPWHVFRNLIDLRLPTASHRPRFTGDGAVWQTGQVLKSNPPDGSWNLFQNTLLVANQTGQASFLHYRDTKGHATHRTFNNVFVAVNPTDDTDQAITFVPSPRFRGPTDGNLYFRIGHALHKPFRYLAYRREARPPRDRAFGCLVMCTSPLRGSLLFRQSKRRYPPGYERRSVQADPSFRRIGADGTPASTDDLRLAEGSPATGHGADLPTKLDRLDPVNASAAFPDIGAFRLGSGTLRVGVNGRRSFPHAGA